MTTKLTPTIEDVHQWYVNGREALESVIRETPFISDPNSGDYLEPSWDEVNVLVAALLESGVLSLAAIRDGRN